MICMAARKNGKPLDRVQFEWVFKIGKKKHLDWKKWLDQENKTEISKGGNQDKWSLSGINGKCSNS